MLHCHAGCEPAAVAAALGLSLADLMPPRTAAGKAKAGPNGSPRDVARYDYRNEAGDLVFQVVRRDPKDFRQRQPKSGGGWNWSVKGVCVVPYRLPELLAEPTRPVVVVEGEKDADNLARIGVLATCNAGGAGKWTAEHAQYLRGRWVVILPDNDEAGRDHAQQVAQSLYGIAKTVRIIELPGLSPKGDVSDWLASGGTKEELKRLAEAAPVWTPDAQPWPELQPFDANELPPFPVNSLPGALREWVQAESEGTQTPSALAGLLSLAVCSATIARRVEVEPRPGWVEPVNLYAAVLLDPGNRKSAVFSDCLQPLREIEAELIETERPAVAKAQSDRRRLEGRLKRAEKLVAENGDQEAAHEADQLAEELAVMSEVALPRLLIDDATSEKLGAMLAEQDGRLASMSPEGGVFDLMAGHYSKNGAVDFVTYLKAHSGDELLTDRISRKSVRVTRPALTCCYTIQPQVIRGLAEQAAFRGRGLLGRFCYAMPTSPVGRRKVAAQPVPESIRESYRELARLLFHSLENIESDSGPFILRMTPEAGELLIDWETEIEAELDDGGSMENMRDWGSKLAGLTVRLAAVLHTAQHGPAGSIDAATLADAIMIGRWSIPHAEAVLNLMAAGESGDQSDARYVLRWIERHGRRQFTKRDAQQHGRRRFPKADDIDSALAELVRRGYIRLRPTETSGPGRPSSPCYEVNPVVFDSGNTEKRTQYSRNSPGEPDNSNSENSESDLGQSENANRERVTI